MKTQYSRSELTTFLKDHLSEEVSSMEQLTEGHSSQAMSFMGKDGKKYVLRVRETLAPLQADKFAYDHFKKGLPIPRVIDVGQVPEGGYYCISEFSEGEILFTINEPSFSEVLPSVHKVLSEIFTTDISFTHSYGYVDIADGNGKADTWKKSLLSELDELNVLQLQQHVLDIGLSRDTLNRLQKQFQDNLPYASENRRLLHGDPGFDNFIVKEGRVCAVVDWEQMAYGDWVRDFSRFEYFGLSNYGDMETFGRKNGLEADHMHERKALYWAINALRDIEFAAVQHNEAFIERLRKTIHTKII